MDNMRDTNSRQTGQTVSNNVSLYSNSVLPRPNSVLPLPNNVSHYPNSVSPRLNNTLSSSARVPTPSISRHSESIPQCQILIFRTFFFPAFLVRSIYILFSKIVNIFELFDLQLPEILLLFLPFDIKQF